MKIRPAKLQDINLIARVHIDAFPGFFLTKMGFNFLYELYRGFLTSPYGILLVVEDDSGNLIGFAAGATPPNLFFSELRKKRGWIFLLYPISAGLKMPIIVLSKLYSALFYSGDKTMNHIGKGALLSCIGVLRRCVGNHVGKELLAKFEEAAFNKKADFIYLTTDEIGNDRVNSFYIRNGYHIDSKFAQDGRRHMLRYIKDVSIRVNDQNENRIE